MGDTTQSNLNNALAKKEHLIWKMNAGHAA